MCDLLVRDSSSRYQCRKNSWTAKFWLFFFPRRLCVKPYLNTMRFLCSFCCCCMFALCNTTTKAFISFNAYISFHLNIYIRYFFFVMALHIWMNCKLKYLLVSTLLAVCYLPFCHWAIVIVSTEMFFLHLFFIMHVYLQWFFTRLESFAYIYIYRLVYMLFQYFFFVFVVVVISFYCQLTSGSETAHSLALICVSRLLFFFYSLCCLFFLSLTSSHLPHPAHIHSFLV